MGVHLIAMPNHIFLLYFKVPSGQVITPHNSHIVSAMNFISELPKKYSGMIYTANSSRVHVLRRRENIELSAKSLSGMYTSFIPEK